MTTCFVINVDLTELEISRFLCAVYPIVDRKKVRKDAQTGYIYMHTNIHTYIHTYMNARIRPHVFNVDIYSSFSVIVIASTRDADSMYVWLCL